MNKLRFYLVALAALFVFSVRADEGMWLLQLMQQQHSIDMMKKQNSVKFLFYRFCHTYQ